MNNEFKEANRKKGQRMRKNEKKKKEGNNGVLYGKSKIRDMIEKIEQ